MEIYELLKVPTMTEFYKIRDELNLSDRQREVFLYKYSRRWFNADIAAELHVDRDTVSADIKVIREKLKQYIHQKCVDKEE